MFDSFISAIPGNEQQTALWLLACRLLPGSIAAERREHVAEPANADARIPCGYAKTIRQTCRNICIS